MSIPVQSTLTSLTGASQVACPRAVADVAIPALPADSIVLAGVGQALFGWLSGARGLHTHCPLRLSQPPDVFALPIYKQVSDTAHITIVQQSCPYLRKRSKVLSTVFISTPLHKKVFLRLLTKLRRPSTNVMITTN